LLGFASRLLVSLLGWAEVYCLESFADVEDLGLRIVFVQVFRRIVQWLKTGFFRFKRRF